VPHDKSMKAMNKWYVKGCYLLNQHNYIYVMLFMGQNKDEMYTNNPCSVQYTLFQDASLFFKIR